MRKYTAGRLKEKAAFILSELVQKHWLFCNIYAICTRHNCKVIFKIQKDR